MGLISFSKFDAAPDLFGHLTIGQRILTDRAISTHNDYSYTEPHHNWVNQYWLAEVLFAAIFKLGGSPALLIWQWLMGAAILLLLLMLLRRKFPGTSELSIFLSLLLALGLIRFGLNLRPQIFTYLNTVILLLLLSENQIRKRQYMGLPLLFLFWVNVHGAVMAGLGLYGLWVLVELLKHWRHSWWIKNQLPHLAGVTVLIILATFINPYGYHLHRFLWWAARLDHGFLMEWQPLDWSTGTNLFFKLALPLWFGLLVYQWRTKTYWDPYYSLISLVTAVLALQHIRHIPFFGIALAPAIVLPLHVLLQRHGPSLLTFWNRMEQQFAAINLTGRMASILVITALVVFGLVPRTGFRLMVTPDQPIAQVKFLKEQGWQGRLLNEYDWGYYLIRELSPEIKVAIDGRYETAYSVGLSRKYLDFIFNTMRNLSYLDSSQADLALLRSSGVPAKVTGTHKNWVLINYDEQAALFATREYLLQQAAFDPRLPELNFPVDYIFK